MSNPFYLIITGDGSGDFKTFEALCEKYNGHHKTLWFPVLGLKKKTGLSALDSIKDFPGDFGINSIIYVVDGEFFNGDAMKQIEDYLIAIGIKITYSELIQEAFLMNCIIGSHKIILYCIILGPRTFIEEELARLIQFELNITIDLLGERDHNWKMRVKSDIDRILDENHTNIKKLIRIARRNNLEKAFPNICAVFGKIEMDC